MRIKGNDASEFMVDRHIFWLSFFFLLIKTLLEMHDVGISAHNHNKLVILLFMLRSFWVKHKNDLRNI